MIRNNQRQLAEALARRAVAETSPKELPLFSVTATTYFADPNRAIAAARSKTTDDEMLGSGIEALVPIITPVALWVAQKVLEALGSQVGEAVKAESAGPIRSLVQRLLQMIGVGGRDGAGPTQVEPLASEELSRIRGVALRQARTLLPEAQAVTVANAIVAELLPSTGT